VVATTLEPAKSHNACLNVVSDTVSTIDIARLLCAYTEEKGEVDVLSLERGYGVWDDLGDAG
jgi:hypothetical protein